MALLAHLDADCFYVSCERVRTPSLRRQPAGVLGNQGACVIARSYEMRPFGVRVGMPIWDAVKLCPQGIFIKRDFGWYEVISRLLLDTLKSISPATEYYSVDEMFFDAQTLPLAFRLPMPEALQALQRRILDEIGIPVTIGASLSKTLAKLAAEAVKPFGCAVLTERLEMRDFLSRKPVDDISGIGQRSKEKLVQHGIHTCWDFACAPRRLIRKLLTIKGERIWWELNGTPANPILTERPQHKAISRGGSLGGATDDPLRLTAWLIRNVERLVEELDHYQVHTERLSLSLWFKGGGGRGDRLALPEATARFDLLAAAAKQLLAKIEVTRPVSRMHLWADRLTSRRPVQGTLFPMPNPTAEKVAKVKQFVNQRVGRFAVRSGDTLPLKDVYTDERQSYDICDIHGKLCF